MSEDRYEVYKAKDVDPERFIIVSTNRDLAQTGSYIMTASGSLTESELRAELAKWQRSEAEINSLIKRARENPR